MTQTGLDWTAQCGNLDWTASLDWTGVVTWTGYDTVW